MTLFSSTIVFRLVSTRHILAFRQNKWKILNDSIPRLHEEKRLFFVYITVCSWFLLYKIVKESHYTPFKSLLYYKKVSHHRSLFGSVTYSVRSLLFIFVNKPSVEWIYFFFFVLFYVKSNYGSRIRGPRRSGCYEINWILRCEEIGRGNEHISDLSECKSWKTQRFI